MKTAWLLILFILVFAKPSYTQRREMFDIVTYVPPKGWKNERTYNVISFGLADNTKGTHCQVALYKTAISKGSLADDFTSEWDALVVKPYRPKTNPILKPVESKNGWDMLLACAPFKRKTDRSIAQLLTITGYGKCMSIVMITNAAHCERSVQEFLNSISPQPLDIEDQSGSFRWPATGG